MATQGESTSSLEAKISRRDSLSRRSLSKKASTFTLIRQSKASLELIQKQTEAQEWIQSVLNVRFPEGVDFPTALEDGVLLCRLAQAIKPGSIKKINPSKARFKMMENLQFFTGFCEEMGIAKHNLFDPVDLTERSNLIKVVACIHHLADIAARSGFQPTMERLISDDDTTKNTRKNQSVSARPSVLTEHTQTKPSDTSKKVSIQDEGLDALQKELAKADAEQARFVKSGKAETEPSTSEFDDLARTAKLAQLKLAVFDDLVEQGTILDQMVPEEAKQITQEEAQKESRKDEDVEGKKEKKIRKDKKLREDSEESKARTPEEIEEERKRKEERKQKRKEKKMKEEQEALARGEPIPQESKEVKDDDTLKMRSWKLKNKSLQLNDLEKYYNDMNVEHQERKKREEAEKAHQEEQSRTRSWKSRLSRTLEKNEMEKVKAEHAAEDDTSKLRSWKTRVRTLDKGEVDKAKVEQVSKQNEESPAGEEPKLRSWKTRVRTMEKGDMEKAKVEQANPAQEPQESEESKLRSWKTRVNRTMEKGDLEKAKAEQAKEQEDTPKMRSWKSRTSSMSGEEKPSMLQQVRSEQEKKKEREKSSDDKLRSWKSKQKSITPEDIQKYYEAHGASQEEALSESLKIRSWKERTRTFTGSSSTGKLQDIADFYANMKKEAERINNEEVLEQQIKSNKTQFMESMGKRVEMRESLDENVVRSPEEEAEDKRERMRIEAVSEILLSERYYVRDLELVVVNFLKSLRSQNLLSEEETETLFSNVELILKVNRTILNNLLQDYQDAGDIQLVNVGRAFIAMINYLKIYSIYSSNHSNAVKCYENLKKKNKNFAAFIKEKEALPECQGINLIGYLIKPVQRLTKYHLLFRELLRYTPKDHIDYADLEQCFNKVQEVAIYVNERQRASESLQKMLEIQENLVDNDKGFNVYDQQRMFIREGTLTFQVELEKPQDMHYFLFNDVLLCCKTRLSNKATFKFRDAIPLEKIVLEDVTEGENAQVSFRIVRYDGFKRKCLATFGNPTEKKFLWQELTKLIEYWKQQTGGPKVGARGSVSAGTGSRASMDKMRNSLPSDSK